MEYIDTDVKKVLKSVTNGTQISEDHIKTILYNLLCCLNFLHSANILHRDIKPANILMTDNCSTKICDLGLARTFP